MLKHISESERKTGEYTYWRTDDPNIIVRQFTSEDEIRIDKLEINIRHFEDRIKRAVPIPYPTGVTEEMRSKIDEMNEMEGISIKSISAMIEQRDAWIATWEQVTKKKWL